MSTWRVAAVQADCRFADRPGNLAAVRANLAAAAAGGAKLVVFPECVLTGYGYRSLDEAWPVAEPVPGPSTDALAADCRRLGVWCVAGTLERDEPAGRLFNSAVLVGPDGLAGCYRKIHLPFMGADRFATPGDRPFAVYDLGGLTLGINICYDGTFPESARVMALMGADLIVLPTNWPEKARCTAAVVAPARALENHVYYLSVNRVGEERGFRFPGGTKLADPLGEVVAGPAGAGEEILYADIDPEWARRKRVVNTPGEHEVDRLNDRRPAMYGRLVE